MDVVGPEAREARRSRELALQDLGPGRGLVEEVALGRAPAGDEDPVRAREVPRRLVAALALRVDLEPDELLLAREHRAVGVHVEAVPGAPDGVVAAARGSTRARRASRTTSAAARTSADPAQTNAITTGRFLANGRRGASSAPAASMYGSFAVDVDDPDDREERRARDAAEDDGNAPVERNDALQDHEQEQSTGTEPTRAFRPT